MMDIRIYHGRGCAHSYVEGLLQIYDLQFLIELRNTSRLVLKY